MEPKMIELGKCPSCCSCGITYLLLVEPSEEPALAAVLLVMAFEHSCGGVTFDLCDAAAYRDLVEEMHQDGVQCEAAAIVLVEQHLASTRTNPGDRVHLVNFMNEYFASAYAEPS